MICGHRPGKFLVMAIIGLAIMLWQPVYAVPSDLILHMRFDDDPSDGVLDSSPYGNHGSCPGGIPALTTDRSGNPNSAYDFNGVDDYVDLGNLDVIGDALTISLWFKADDFNPNDVRLISKSSTTARESHYWMLSTRDPGDGIKLRFGLKTGEDPSIGTTTLIADPGSELEIGVWTHAAVTYDGATMKIYKDAVLVGSTPKTGTVSTNPTIPAWIGRNPDGYGPWNGIIDDARIYNGALSDSEVLALYNGNIPPDISAMPDVLTKIEGDTITPAEIELATDLDGDPLTYTYSGWPTSLPYTTTYEDKGTHILHVDVSDGTDTAVKDITIVVYGADGLAGYWKFDETSGPIAQDSSGMGNTGILLMGQLGQKVKLVTP